MRAAHGLAIGLAVLAAAAREARAIVTGNVEVQSQTVRTQADTGSGSQASTATLLQENVSMHYAGLPFGPAFALVTLGGGFSNIDGGLGNGVALHGRSTSWDLSAAFLPRRAYPLRIFTHGSLVEGSPGIVATTGGPLTLGYGASLNLEPGHTLPGLRVDVEEDRASHVANTSLNDVRRTAIASAYKSYGAENLNLTVRLDDESRFQGGSFLTRSGNFAWTSPQHQTIVAASENRHTSVDIAGLTAEREASATHVQRISDSLSANGSVRLAEADAPGASGERGNAQAGVSVQPITGEQLILSAGANGGFATTNSGTANGRGTSFGGDVRAGYSWPLAGWMTSVFLSGAADRCNCDFGNSGLQEAIGGGLSVGRTMASRLTLQGDYSVQRVFAPLTRGGRRLEQHVRGTVRTPITDRLDGNLSAGYDDAYRVVIDLRAGTAYTLRERAGSAALGANYRFDRGSLFGELRYVRGDAIVPTSAFVAGAPVAAHTMKNATLSGAYALFYSLDLTAQLSGSWTDVNTGPPMTSNTGMVGAVFKFGRMTFSASYQLLHTEFSGVSSNQQTIRATFARPFEI
ncbi:MAG: hypothetical protein ACJ78X_06315 [Myxococcales bacterium]